MPYTALLTASLAFFAASLKLSVAEVLLLKVVVVSPPCCRDDGGDIDASCLAFATTLSIHCETFLLLLLLLLLLVFAAGG